MELPLIFLGGLLGSAHCVGMCGGFALIIGMRPQSRHAVLLSQLIYSSGRIFTYIFLGALAATFGERLAARTSQWGLLPPILSLTAGTILIAQGLAAAGIHFWPKRTSAAVAQCLPRGAFRSLLQGPGNVNAFLAGVLTGLMPCGLLYGFLALSASTVSLPRGMLLMAAFGLGTVPLMVATGWAGNLVTGISRRRLMSLAAWCVVLTGVLTLSRGSYAILHHADQAKVCPFCSQGTQDVISTDRALTKSASTHRSGQSNDQ